MRFGLNRASTIFYSDKKRFQNILRAEKILRRIDDVYLIDSTGNILLSDVSEDIESFVVPSDNDFDEAIKGNVVSLSDTLENKTSVMLKLNSLVDTYLYISRNIDPEILRYFNETEEAVSFYYSVENSQTGIKITFAIIYIIVVTLLLFLSMVIAISFATNFTRPIINLISASKNISKGLLDAQVPEIDADEEFKLLNKNFNSMIDRLKKQQDKLLASERHLAWETVARKLAHEIKNPLTPIQLSIDRLRERYSKKIGIEKKDFENYLQTINRQIKDIEKLVNEFSNFARMPSPVFKKIKINEVIKRALDFLKASLRSEILYKENSKNLTVKGDQEQLYRVFINLIKNSEESILEKVSKNPKYKGKIGIEINENKDYIVVSLHDNGSGMSDTKKALTPYYTTKKGTGLGLPIVSKIISEHSGEFSIKNQKKNGVKVELSFLKN